MQQAEYNHEDFNNTNEADKSLLVRFFYKNVENKMESQKQGRPIFKEKLYVEIRIAGQRDVQACRPATHADKQRFPLHLDAFEKRMEPPTEGMPLIEWPKITRTQAEELAFLNVKTVEQLASMRDSNLQKLMNGFSLRDQAVAWLETNSQETEDREKAELKATIAVQQEQIDKLLAAAGLNTTEPEDLASSLDAEDEQPEDEQPEDEQPEDEQPEDEQPEVEQPEDEQPEDEQPEVTTGTAKPRAPRKTRKRKA